MSELATTSGTSSPALAPDASAPAPRKNGRRLRLLPLAIGVSAMAAGIWTGLARLGVALPGGVPAIADFHGALMISGFLGTLISLERAVALQGIPIEPIGMPSRFLRFAHVLIGKPVPTFPGHARGRGWPYAAPALSSLGALALLAGMPGLAVLGFIAASAVLLLASAWIALRQRALFTIVLTVGAACWTAGTLCWLLRYPTPAVVGWWLDFLVLTIAAERLELGRLASPPRSSEITFAGAVLLLLIGAARGELAQALTSNWAPFTALGLLACAAWLLRHDIARRTVRIAGQPRFSAVAILLGHGWLGVAGLWLLVAPPGTAAFSYDAAVHAITIGFVLSMIFGHAPIILPAVTGLRLRHCNLAYLSLAVLHVSVVARLAGDLIERPNLRVASGMLTVIALAGYAATLILARTRAAPRAA